MRQQYIEEIPLPNLNYLSPYNVDKQLFIEFKFTNEEVNHIRKVIVDKKQEIINTYR